MACSQPSPRFIIAIGLSMVTCFLLFSILSHDSAVSLNVPGWSKESDAKPDAAPQHQEGAPEHHEAAPEHDLLDDIKNTTLGFQKVYILGLPERSDRRDAMVLQARLTGIEVEFIDGVHGDTIPDKAIPKETEHGRMNDGELGCWRVHVDAMRRIVNENVQTALILEDDADWDVRLRDILRDAAIGNQALTQPLKGTTDQYADASYNPRQAVDKKQHTTINTLQFDGLPEIEKAKLSPYGDNWDLFWTGHCGSYLPDPSTDLPRGRVVKLNDPTVPPTKRIDNIIHPYHLNDQYPYGTRVYHHAHGALCTLSYAVSQTGARALLRDMGMNDVRRTSDVILKDFCDGKDAGGHYTCVAASPAIFNHFRSAGPMDKTSDINKSYKGWRKKGLSQGTRWSVRLNADRIIRGEPLKEQHPEDYTDEAIEGHKRAQGQKPLQANGQPVQQEEKSKTN